MERISVCVPAAIGWQGHHRAGGTRQIPGGGRGTLELSDGSGNHLRHSALAYLLRFPPQDERRSDHGRGKRLNAAPTASGEKNKMKLISRRRALGGVGAAVVAAGTGLMPRRAKAAGELTVWWTQGFYKAENDAVIAWMADWEKRNNTKINLTIMNGPDVITKLIAGMQVGDVPDVVHTVTGDRFLVPRAAWNDQLEDVSDVVESQKAEFMETALITARLYNAKQKKNSYYGVPNKASSLP